jgi:hypothetical protein
MVTSVTSSVKNIPPFSGLGRLYSKCISEEFLYKRLHKQKHHKTRQHTLIYEGSAYEYCPFTYIAVVKQNCDRHYTVRE